jgi:signal transduction histidine kinase
MTIQEKNVEKVFSEAHFGIKPGVYACLAIEDNGKGMGNEEINRLFDPFFTTKFQGRGMGMAAVHGIVKNHDGWIFVDSKLGKGTTISIYLPIAEMED